MYFGFVFGHFFIHFFGIFFFSLSFYISFCICKLRSIEWKRKGAKERHTKMYLSTSFIQFEVDIEKSLSKSLIRLIKNMCLARKHAPLIDRISFLFVCAFFIFIPLWEENSEQKFRFDSEPHTSHTRLKVKLKCIKYTMAIQHTMAVTVFERGEFVKWPFRRWCELREEKIANAHSKNTAAEIYWSSS